MSHRCLTICAVPLMVAIAAPPTSAEDVIVTVEGAQNVPSEVAYRFYDSPGHFSFGKATAGKVGSGQSARSMVCVLRNFAPGSYALVAAILPRRLDDVTRDLLGSPSQPWGVSKNIRPAMRAPRYNEAIFTVERRTATRLKIWLAK